MPVICRHFFVLNVIRKIPLLSYLIPMLIGIIVGIYFEFEGPFFTVFFVFVLAVYVLFLFYDSLNFSIYKSYFFIDLIILFLFVLGGVVLVQFHSYKNYSSYFENYISSSSIYFAELTAPIKQKNRSVLCEVALFKVIKEDIAIEVTGEAVVYLKKDDLASKLLNGDRIVFKAEWQEIEAPKNPGQFNYKKYLAFNRIYYQSFIDKESWKLVKRDNANLFTLSNSWRNKFLYLIKKSGIKADQFSVASALTVGSKDLISKELKHSYSSAGAMHVLAVSGLHVGIIYWIIQSLLNVLLPLRRFIFFKAFMVLFFLWFYAFLSGLSPSVLRATTMLSFVVIGFSINRKSNVYNNLAASAFVLLMVNPYLIMQVGFQLSYLAVIGILFFQSRIYQLINVKNLLVDKIWLITSVSIAAQLTTFPLSLLYFHQFPVYFIVSNLLVIPAAFLILVGVLLLLVFQLYEPLFYWFGGVLNSLIGFVNSFVLYIDGLPFSLIDGISISVLETYLIFCFILFFSCSFIFRKAHLFLYALLFLISIGLIDVLEDIKLSSKKQLVVYSIKNHLAVNIYLGKKNFFISDKELFNNQDKMLFTIKHHWYDLDVKHPNYINIDTVHTIGLYLNESRIELNTTQSSNADFFLRIVDDNSIEIQKNETLLLSKKVENVEKMVINNPDNNYILSSNLNYSQLNKLVALAKKNNITYYNVNDVALLISF